MSMRRRAVAAAATALVGLAAACGGGAHRLAGEVIEAVTGQPLEDVYRERILDPLGMDDTWLDCREEPRADMARGLHPPGVDNPEVLSFPLPGQGNEVFDVTEPREEAPGLAPGPCA